MTDDQAQRRLRLNYVVAELDAVLSELLADVPFVTEETLHSKYHQLCGKELKSELDAVGMTLYDLVELKFADVFLAVRGSRLPGILRLKFVNQQAVLAADASRKDAGVQEVIAKSELEAVGTTLYDLVELKFADVFLAVRGSRLPGILRLKFVSQQAVLAADASREDAGVQEVIAKAEPVAVSVDSLDSDPADAAVAAADASDDGPPEPKRARMGEPEERGENAGDAVVRSEPAVVRVGPEPRVMSYFAAAQSLGASKIQSKNLEATRGALLRNHKRATDRVALSVFDFFELMKSESTLTTAQYLKWKRSGMFACGLGRLSFGLKGLRAKCAHDPGRVYTIVQAFRVPPPKHYVDYEKGGKISVKDLFEMKYGVRLEYPRLPIVVVDAPDGRRQFVPMECVQLVENKKLLFVSVLAARQATP